MRARISDDAGTAGRSVSGVLVGDLARRDPGPYTHLMPSSEERTRNAVNGLYTARGTDDGPPTAQAA